MSENSMIMIRGMIFIGAVLLASGVITYCIKRRRELEISIFLASIGFVCTVGSIVMNFIPPSDGVVVVIYLFVLGAILLGGGIIGILKRRMCRVEVEGTVLSIEDGYRGQFEVKFKYHYNDETYTEYISPSVEWWTVKRFYTEKQKVTINIDPKMPTRFYDKRRFPIFSTVLLVLGGAFMLLWLLALIGVIIA